MLTIHKYQAVSNSMDDSPNVSTFSSTKRHLNLLSQNMLYKLSSFPKFDARQIEFFRSSKKNARMADTQH